jgi:hypothetical protein
MYEGDVIHPVDDRAEALDDADADKGAIRAVEEPGRDCVAKFEVPVREELEGWFRLLPFRHAMTVIHMFSQSTVAPWVPGFMLTTTSGKSG